MKHPLAIALALALGLGAQSAANAEVKFSGFGQVIAGTTGSDTRSYPGRSFDGDIDFQQESLFGLQATAEVNPRITAVGQLVARGHRDFEPEFAWAYANIRLDHGFSVKAGRQRLPAYRYTDFLDVGYAYPWMRPPTAVYNLDLDSSDGVSLSHNHFFGKWFSQAQILVGAYEGSARMGTRRADVEMGNQVAAAWELEYNEWLSLRAAYVRADLTIASDLDQLGALLRANGQGILADRIVIDDDTGEFTNFGVKVDRNNWLLVSEYITTKTDGALIAKHNDWYLSAGHRFGQVMPYVVYGERRADPRNDILDLVPAGSPLRPVLAGAVAAGESDERYTSIGARWDFMANVAVKADWTRYRSSVGVGERSDLASVGLVFTF